jgi:hypothetical protein
MVDNVGREVHCLACDHVYPETWPLARSCPACDNRDMENTVYLQTQEDDDGLHDNSGEYAVCLI